jgi:hypothetical protein
MKRNEENRRERNIYEDRRRERGTEEEREDGVSRWKRL